MQAHGCFSADGCCTGAARCASATDCHSFAGCQPFTSRPGRAECCAWSVTCCSRRQAHCHSPCSARCVRPLCACSTMAPYTATTAWSTGAASSRRRCLTSRCVSHRAGVRVSEPSPHLCSRSLNPDANVQHFMGTHAPATTGPHMHACTCTHAHIVCAPSLCVACAPLQVEYIDVPKRMLMTVPGYTEPVEFGVLTSFA